MAYVNPILFREQRVDAARIRKRPIRSVITLLGVLWVWLVPLGIMLSFRRFEWQDFRSWALVACHLQVAYFALKAVINGAGSFARERELRTLETLMSTPLSLPGLLGGKIQAVMLPLVGEALLAIIPSLCLMIPQEYTSHNYGWPQVAGVFVLNLVCIGLFGTLGILFSIGARSTIQAATTGIFCALFLGGGTAFFDALRFNHDYQHNAWPFWLTLNPYGALYSLLEGSRDVQWAFLWPITFLIYIGVAVVVKWVCLARLQSTTA